MGERSSYVCWLLGSADSGLPVAEILVLAGFLMIYMVEELMHFVLVKYGNLGRPASGSHLVRF